jgi:hypothetical protein
MSFEEFANNTYRKFDNTLTVHLTNAPKEINWASTPRDLILSIAKNKYLHSKKTRRTIGHITVELNYVDEDGKKVHRFGGQGVKDLTQFASKLVKEGYGFSVILGPDHLKQYKQLEDKPLVTIDGRFEDSNELIEEFNENIYKDDLNAFVTYQLTLDTCKKLVKFFDEYEKHTQLASENPSHEKKAATRYGFGADTLNFDGAGCATFAEAFYVLSGLGDHYKNFYSSVYVPEDYFGNPDKGQKVGLGKILFSKVNLSKQEKTSLYVQFPDPNNMFWAMKSTFENKDSFDGLPVVEKGKFGDSKSFYLVFDARK